jgi:hypothetical protein
MFCAETESDFPVQGCVPLFPVLNSESDTINSTCPGFMIIGEVTIPLSSSFIKESSINERCSMDSRPLEGIQISFWLESLEIITGRSSAIGSFKWLPSDPHAEFYLGVRFCSPLPLAWTSHMPGILHTPLLCWDLYSILNPPRPDLLHLSHTLHSHSQGGL